MPLAMFFRSYPPGLVILVAALWAATGGGVRAVEEVDLAYQPRIESGVNAAVGGGAPYPKLDLERRKSSGWELGAFVAAAYDSNVFLRRENPKSDMVYRAGPTVAYSTADALESEGGFFKMAYRPVAVRFARNGAENRVDQQALITAGWRAGATVVKYTGDFQKLGDPTADVGQLTDRIEMKNEVSVAWQPREKVTLETSVGKQATEYQDPALFDVSRTYGQVAARFAYSPKTRVGAIYQHGRLDVDGAGKQSTNQVAGEIDWQPREKIRVRAVAGMERRQTENGTRIYPVTEGRVEWNVREGTNLYVTGYRREEASAFFAGQNFRVQGVSAGVAQRVADRWTVRLEGGREGNRYAQVSGSGAAGRTDRTWYLRPAVEYKISDDLNVAMFYRRSSNQSTSQDFGFEQRMIGLELNYRF